MAISILMHILREVLSLCKLLIGVREKFWETCGLEGKSNFEEVICYLVPVDLNVCVWKPCDLRDKIDRGVVMLLDYIYGQYPGGPVLTVPGWWVFLCHPCSNLSFLPL